MVTLRFAAFGADGGGMTEQEEAVTCVFSPKRNGTAAVYPGRTGKAFFANMQHRERERHAVHTAGGVAYARYIIAEAHRERREGGTHHGATQHPAVSVMSGGASVLAVHAAAHVARVVPIVESAQNSVIINNGNRLFPSAPLHQRPAQA